MINLLLIVLLILLLFALGVAIVAMVTACADWRQLGIRPFLCSCLMTAVILGAAWVLKAHTVRADHAMIAGIIPVATGGALRLGIMSRPAKPQP